MNKLSNFLLILTFIGSIYAQGVCNPKDRTYLDLRTNVQNLQPDMPGLSFKRVIGGRVRVVDGCTLEIKNFTIVPTVGKLFLWGEPKQGKELIPRISVNGALGNYNGQQIQLKFNGEIESLGELNAVILYNEENPGNPRLGVIRFDGKVEGDVTDAGLDDDLRGSGSENLIISSILILFSLLALML